MELRNAMAGILALGWSLNAPAQIDPYKRELIQLGYNQPLQGKAPIAAYGFYYLNKPEFFRTNLTLRLAVAPVYLDGELGIAQALGEHTDAGLGLFGGGFAESYSEIRGGQWLRGESFTGHGGGVSASVYHLFNPGRQIPLYGVLRAVARGAVYDEDSETAANFRLPDNVTSFDFRAGVRLGGNEPLILPPLAMELSAWYEAQLRTQEQDYGFNGDRQLESASHRFWGRAMLTYTLPRLKHRFALSLTSGVSLHADRFSAYRLGGMLPLSSEFPLALPGYYYQELSAQSFALFGGNYTLPLDEGQRWSLNIMGASAYVNYLPGLEEPRHWNSGVSGGVVYRSPSDSWQLLVAYGYGLSAQRSGGHGAHTIGALVQFDLGGTRQRLLNPGENPNRSRGLGRLLQIFR